MVKPPRECKRSKRTGKGTLSLSQLRLADVGQKSWVGRTYPRVMTAGLRQAELPIHRKANLGCIDVFLTVVFPPADRAESHRTGCVKGLMSATRAAESDFDCFHEGIDEESREGDYS